jgi:hypothetical protein
MLLGNACIVILSAHFVYLKCAVVPADHWQWNKMKNTNKKNHKSVLMNLALFKPRFFRELCINSMVVVWKCILFISETCITLCFWNLHVKLNVTMFVTDCRHVGYHLNFTSQCMPCSTWSVFNRISSVSRTRGTTKLDEYEQ